MSDLYIIMVLCVIMFGFNVMDSTRYEVIIGKVWILGTGIVGIVLLWCIIKYIQTDHVPTSLDICIMVCTGAMFMSFMLMPIINCDE